MEQGVKKEFGQLDAKLSPKEKRGRFDIKYKKSSGKHIIIELKRSNRTMDEYELIAQVDNYRNALEKLVKETGNNEPVEVICIVGKPLKQWETSAEKEEESRKIYGGKEYTRNLSTKNSLKILIELIMHF